MSLLHLVLATMVLSVSISAEVDPKVELPECGAGNIEVQFFNAYIDIENLPPSCNSRNLIDIGFLIQDVVEEVDGLVPLFREEKMLTTVCPFPDTIASTRRYQATGRGERCMNSQAAGRLLQTRNACSVAEKTIKLQQKAEYVATKCNGILRSMMERANNDVFESVDLGELLERASDGAQVCQEAAATATKASQAAADLCSLENLPGSSSDDIIRETETESQTVMAAVIRGKNALSRVKRVQHEMNVVYYMQAAQSPRKLQGRDVSLHEEEVCSLTGKTRVDLKRAEAAAEEADSVLRIIKDLEHELDTDKAASILRSARDDLKECEDRRDEVEDAANKMDTYCDQASRGRGNLSSKLKRAERTYDSARESADEAVDLLAKMRRYQDELEQDLGVAAVEPTNTPTATPTSRPTAAPTSSPTEAPTLPPSNPPTGTPTSSPTALPTRKPDTPRPTSVPTAAPTSGPTGAPLTETLQGDEWEQAPSAAPSSLFVKLLARPFEREYVTRLYSNLDESDRECEGVAEAVQQRTIAEEALLTSDDVFEEITDLALGHRKNADVNRIRVDAFLSNIQIQDESAKVVAAAEMASELCSQGLQELVRDEVEIATIAANQTRIALADLKMARDKMTEVVSLIDFDPVLSDLSPTAEEDEIKLLRHLGEVETEVSRVDSQMQELPEAPGVMALSRKRGSLVEEQMEVEEVLTADVPFRISHSALKKDEYYQSVSPNFEETPPLEYLSRARQPELTEGPNNHLSRSRQPAASRKEWFQAFGESLVEDIQARLLLGYNSQAGGCITEESDLSVVMVITEVASIWDQFDPLQCSTAFLAREPGRGSSEAQPEDPYLILNTVPENSPTNGPTSLPTTNPTSSPTINPTSLPTKNPTSSPTVGATSLPTKNPTNSPTDGPTSAPTMNPTNSPTDGPTSLPTSVPTSLPTVGPTSVPTMNPTSSPTVGPTSSPTANPTSPPTVGPTSSPTMNPTGSPTVGPTSSPTTNPTEAPTPMPTDKPDSPPVTKIFGALQDAYARDGRYSDRKMGAENPIRLDVKLGDPKLNHNRRSFLQFDLRDIDGVVTKASIFLKVYGARSVPVLHNLHAVSDDSWDEKEINWNNMPNLGPILDSQTIPIEPIAEGNYFEYDVTSYVNSKVSQGKSVASFAVAADPSMWDLLIKYYSKEADSSDRPRFEVTYIPTD